MNGGIGLVGRSSYIVFAMAGTIVLAVLSWFCVERPAIKRKKRPLIPLTDAAAAR